MNAKSTLAAAKSKMKKYAPAILATTGAIATVAGIVSYRKHGTETFKLTAEDREAMKDEDFDIRYSIDGSDYAIRYVGNTPQQ